MRRLYPLTASLILGLLTVTPATAQNTPGALSNAILLLDQKSIQEELKLDKDQAAKVTEALKKQMTVRQGIRDLEADERPKKIAELDKESEKLAQGILKPEQAKRLKQIMLQVVGARAFQQPDVVAALKLTDAQKEQVADVMKEIGDQVKGLRGPGGSPAAVQKKMQELTKTGREKIVKTLTPEQQAKWKEMSGDPFKGELRIGPPDRLQQKKP
jgi:hypothetical protein